MNDCIFVRSPVILTVSVFGVTSTMCPLNMLVYCIISDFTFSSGACIFISASSLFIVFSGFSSLTFSTSISLFSCFVICSSAWLSPVVLIVILDIVGSSVFPTVMLSMLKFLLVNSLDILCSTLVYFLLVYL